MARLYGVFIEDGGGDYNLHLSTRWRDIDVNPIWREEVCLDESQLADVEIEPNVVYQFVQDKDGLIYAYSEWNEFVLGHDGLSSIEVVEDVLKVLGLKEKDESGDYVEQRFYLESVGKVV